MEQDEWPETYVEFLNQNRYNRDVGIPFGRKIVRLIQCDQTASSFPLKIIEEFLSSRVYPFYTNTHSNNVLGQYMSQLFADAKRKVMSGLNASTEDYSLIFTGSGCSGAVNHLIHLIRPKVEASTVIVSEAEHYSNLLPWFHVAKRVILLSTHLNSGTVDLDQLDSAINIHLVNGPVIVSMTACSNVTGVIQPVESIARVCKRWNVPCFFDYATSGPYVPIDLNRDLPDAVFLSSHKFPGGPSGPGILVEAGQFSESVRKLDLYIPRILKLEKLVAPPIFWE
ncbi:hypothetical protein HDU78_000774 [Chytriomyces hyalinus]|nr:hypothetical protein HDU78_000774 [Chytriomyces hyalinus]